MSTNKTANYGLHAWVAGDDFLREEINENFALLDAGTIRIVMGSYVGDGTADRVIELGITPLAVLVEDFSGYQGQNTLTRGLVLREYPLNYELLSIVEGGFRVRDRITGSQFNVKNTTHYYIAFY